MEPGFGVDEVRTIGNRRKAYAVESFISILLQLCCRILNFTCVETKFRVQPSGCRVFLSSLRIHLADILAWADDKGQSSSFSPALAASKGGTLNLLPASQRTQELFVAILLALVAPHSVLE
jgi:hypothetical protein